MKSRHAHGNILAAFRSAVSHPLATGAVDRLPGVDVDGSAFVLDVHYAGEHDRVFIELRTLAGLGPSGGAAHMRDADLFRAGVDAPDVLVDLLVPWNWDDG